MFLKVKDRYSAKTTLINKDNIIYKLFITYSEDDLNLSKRIKRVLSVIVFHASLVAFIPDFLDSPMPKIIC